MRRPIIFFAVCFILCSHSRASAQYPSSFLNVHCEPNDASLFPRLVELVALADSFGIPLNIQLTPQWGSDILGDPVKLDQVRQWQIAGHEIGAHHHGIEAGSGWDGYTGHPPSDWPNPLKHNGNMSDYMNILTQAAGDSLLVNGGFGDTDDWPAGLLFRTHGQALEEAISRPVYEKNNGQDCYAVSHSVAFTEKKVDSLITLHASAGPDDVFGFNNHVFNFDFSQTYLRKWMAFIAGKNNQTVRQIMRERGLLTSVGRRLRGSSSPKGFRLYPNYPNPFNPSTAIRYSIPEKARVKLTIYNFNGREAALLIDEVQESGDHEIIWDAKPFPSGIYLIQVVSDISRQVQKCLLLR